MTNVHFESVEEGHQFSKGLASFMIEYLYQTLGYSDSLVSDETDDIDW